MRVVVVGAGVSGMTTALVFQREGHDVQVVAEHPGIDSTSGAAGAIWLPVRIEAGGPELRWSAQPARFPRPASSSADGLVSFGVCCGGGRDRCVRRCVR